ncbi:sensor histidine kinase [Albibacterium indicum]|uniref:sensor histidine kinase n=1 Tax=Albibacterium indicum TaxID=2292082 RepID=UPI000E473EE9|nr:sensor histidine kinase [Pedobacter indicus]
MKYFLTIGLVILLGGIGHASQTKNDIEELYKEGFKKINENLNEAKSLIDRGFQLSLHRKDQAGIADGYFYKGCLFDRMMQVDSAILYLNKANTLFHILDKTENIPDAYGRLGLLFIKKSQPQEGLRHLIEALKLAEEYKNPAALVRNTIVLAMHHNDYTREYDEAIKYLQQAETSARQLDDRNLLGHVYLQYSISYNNKGESGEAIEYSQRSAEEFKAIHSTYNQMRALFTLAQVYREIEEPLKIQQVLAEIEPLLNENSDNLMKANYAKLLSEAYYLQDKFEESLVHAEEASELLRLGGQTQGVFHMSDLLFRLYYLLGDRAKADSIYKQYAAMDDSLYSRERMNLDADLRQKYESEKRMQQIELQNLELVHAKYFRQGLIGILILAVILCVVVYGRLREKAKNERILNLKNEKIERQFSTLRQLNEYNETLLREIHHRVKNNLQIISSLFSIQARNIHHPEVINLIEKSKSRLKTISIIHNTLYSQKSLNRIRMSDFIKEIGESLFEIYNVDGSFLDTLDLNIKGTNIFLNADTSLPVGLIVNELITNSLKYAFSETNVSRSGNYSTNDEDTMLMEGGEHNHQIEIIINKIGESEYELKYSDSGSGLDDAIDVQTSKTTGIRLMRGLIQQLNGSMEYHKDYASHYFLIRFKEAG